jgi:hypothetical protein
MFIRNVMGHKVGDRVVTTRDHTALVGTMQAGTEVIVTAIDDMRGYSIVDDEGNRLIECGWEL